MKQIKKYYKDIIINIIFIITYLIIFLITTKNGKYIFGSTMDYDVQHSIIPEYLRMIFYNSHSILPKFSFNLAAGTNIYNLAYYGLLNPIILISYLFPKVKMLNYIVISTSIVIILSTSLIYFYLRKNKYSYKISFICSILFLCAGPIIFHAHRHIMFINYLPFLILGFYGIDRYLEKKKSLLLIISIILMIFTSYFFSVAGIASLTILGIYKYLKKKPKQKIKETFTFTIKLIIKYIPAILISSILIVPTAFALLNGRGTSQGTNILKDILMPKEYLLYGHYSMGLTLISLITLIYFIFKGKKANKVLSIIILFSCICSIPAFILNGFLYVNGKILITFIPLVIILIAEFLKEILPKIKYKKVLIGYLLVSALLLCIYENTKDSLILNNKEDFKIESYYQKKVNEIIDKNQIYRIKTTALGKQYINKVSNPLEYKTTSYLSSNNNTYNDAYKYLFENPLTYRNSMMYDSTNNIIFEMYMGEKYIFTKDEYTNIYKKIDNYKDVNVYENEYVLPIGYASNNYINENEFKDLEYPNKTINLLGTIVTDKDTNIKIKEANKIDYNYDINDYENLEYELKDNYIEVNAKNNATMTLENNNNYNNKLLFISFIVEDSNNKDLRIKINNINNTLTCKTWKYYNNNKTFNYVLSENQNTLNLEFTKGKYKIRDINLYTINLDEILNINEKIDPLIIDKKKSDNSNIVGNIDVSEDKYITISIPYDNNYKILVDNKTVKYEKVNNSFVGFPITKGKHTISINYNPKGYKLGIIMSIIGLLSLLILIKYERRNINGNKK